jgi:hypothetical protein
MESTYTMFYETQNCYHNIFKKQCVYVLSRSVHTL